MDHAICLGVFHDELTVADCSAETLSEERTVYNYVVARQKSDSYLRFVAVKCAALEAPAFIRQPDYGSGLRLGYSNVALVNPQVAGPQTVDAVRADYNRAFCHALYLGE
jgi:hypothetical protein